MCTHGCPAVAVLLVILTLPGRISAGDADHESREIKALVQDLEDKDWKTRSKALGALSKRVEASKGRGTSAFSAAVEPLMSMIGWGGIARRDANIAADTLTRIGKPAVPKLVEGLSSPEARLRRACAEILTAIRPERPALIELLVPLIPDKDRDVRRACFRCLGSLGKDAREAAPFLERALGDPAPSNDIVCLMALIQITGQRDPYAAKIAAFLKHADPLARQAAASALGECDPPAKGLWRDLSVCLEDSNAQVRLNAASSLGAIGTRSPEVVSALIHMLEHDKSREVRRTAASSLGKIGTKAQAAIPALAKVLKEAHVESQGNRTGWWVAARSVGRIGGPDAVPVLTEALNNGDPDIRLAAARALGDLGALSRPALPALKQCVNDRFAGGAASEAIRKIRDAINKR